MALFKKMLVLGAIVALMPTDDAQQARLYERAASAVHWTMTFCDRNSATCAQGQALWATFAQKAEFGAGLVYSLIQQHVTARETPSQPVSVRPAAPRGTLSPDDMRPLWRGAAGT